MSGRKPPRRAHDALDSEVAASLADERETRADERDTLADERDTLADERTNRADERTTRADERETRADERDTGGAVEAHRVLNSAAVVIMSLEHVQRTDLGITEDERQYMLDRSLAHARLVVDALKRIIQGAPVDV